MDWVSTPEVREAALRAELGSLLNSIDRPAKERRIREVKAQLGEAEDDVKAEDGTDDETAEDDESAPKARRAPAKKAG